MLGQTRIRQALVAGMLSFAGLNTVGAPANTGSETLAVEIHDVGAGKEALTVFKDGRRVFELVGSSFDQAQAVEAGQRRPLPFLTDVTGDGRLDLVVSELTGGGHLSHLLHVVDLGGSPQEIACVAGGGPEIEYFEDVDADGKPEYLTHDWSFSGWQTCVADSPAPRVVLRLRNDGPVVAWPLMRSRDPLTLDGNSKGEVLGTVLRGLYTDRAKQAWGLFEDAWPTDSTVARVELVEKLGSGPYGSQLSSH